MCDNLGNGVQIFLRLVKAHGANTHKSKSMTPTHENQASNRHMRYGKAKGANTQRHLHLAHFISDFLSFPLNCFISLIKNMI